jgi:hypothetical protein
MNNYFHRESKVTKIMIHQWPSEEKHPVKLEGYHRVADGQDWRGFVIQIEITKICRF